MKKNNRGETNTFTAENSTYGLGSGLEIRSKQFFENRIEREWLSTEEAAYYLRLSEGALRIMVHRGQIPVARIGKRLRFRLKDCEGLITKGAC